MYSLLVIEGDIDPEYFLDKMQMYELSILLKNIFKKNKESWEQARLVAYVIAQTNSTKQIKPTDIIKFSWENEEADEETSITEEDRTRLREKANNYLTQL